MKLGLIQTSESYRITSLIVKEGTSEELITTASALALCYHVKHSLSYNNSDCNTKLGCPIFRDLRAGSILSVEEQKLRPL
jgi:hypothetical protein